MCVDGGAYKAEVASHSQHPTGPDPLLIVVIKACIKKRLKGKDRKINVLYLELN